MITRLKMLNKAYFRLNSMRSLRNIFHGRKYNPLLNMELFKKYEKQGSKNSAQIVTNVFQKNQNEPEYFENKSYFMNKMLIGTGVILLIYFKFIEFADCEKQSKAEKEKCKNKLYFLSCLIHTLI